MLSIAPDELNWFIVEKLMMNFLEISFYCFKRILIWQKVLEVFEDFIRVLFLEYYCEW